MERRLPRDFVYRDGIVDVLIYGGRVFRRINPDAAFFDDEAMLTFAFIKERTPWDYCPIGSYPSATVTDLIVIWPLITTEDIVCGVYVENASLTEPISCHDNRYLEWKMIQY
jgi:hypothetical protein